MRTSQLFAPTLRQVSGEVELTSHKLLLRAGCIRQLAAGLYSLLPLGLRVVRKIETIIREEMDRAGAQEVLLPALHPLELWEQSGRAEYWGDELMKLKDRGGRPFCLGGTHEEVITSLVGSCVRSYRELPLTLYQIQTKFRDDPRPRGGLIRVREFTMKDAYSFDRDVPGLDRSYDAMVEAYHRILPRLGLTYHVVLASGGGIGGWDTKEFEMPTEVGESHYLICDKCDYAATPEVAEPAPQEIAPSEAPLLPLERVDTPDQRTIEHVTAFLGLPAKKLVKTLIYVTGDRVIAALVRGDRELSEDKLKAALGITKLQMADAEVIRRVTSAPVGFAGPVGIRGAEIIADEELRGERNFVTGGNEADLHRRNVNWDRDFTVSQWAKLRCAEAGDPCPCGGAFAALRGIELAHVFKLGTIYSDVFDATYLDEAGERKAIVMGCYGIGSTRLVASIVEQCHDENGIVWPPSVAPFDAEVILVNQDEAAQVELATRLYDEFRAAGLDTLLEDRAERPGVKFKDADLIGIPVQVVVGRLAGEGKVEVRRRGGESRTVEAAEALTTARELLSGG